MGGGGGHGDSLLASGTFSGTFSLIRGAWLKLFPHWYVGYPCPRLVDVPCVIVSVPYRDPFPTPTPYPLLM